MPSFDYYNSSYAAFDIELAKEVNPRNYAYSYTSYMETFRAKETEKARQYEQVFKDIPYGNSCESCGAVANCATDCDRRQLVLAHEVIKTLTTQLERAYRCCSCAFMGTGTMKCGTCRDSSMLLNKIFKAEDKVRKKQV